MAPKKTTLAQLELSDHQAKMRRAQELTRQIREGITSSSAQEIADALKLVEASLDVQQQARRRTSSPADKRRRSPPKRKTSGKAKSSRHV